jgi:hypothetical protein
VVDLLEETLGEEKETDRLLTQIAADEINPGAIGEEEETEQTAQEQEEARTRRAASGTRKGAARS